MASGKKGGTISVAAELAQHILDQMGLKLWDLRFEKEGSLWYLRYFIDKEGGVSVNDCENFSRAIDKRLDQADPIDQSYTLEVSSPGIERELTRDWHFERCMGQVIAVRFIRPVEGVRDFVGTLTAYENGSITMLLEDDVEMTFQKTEVSFVRIYNDYAKEDFGTEEDGGEKENG